MVYFKTSKGRWVLQIGNIKYYVFLCEMGSVNFYALHRVINNDYDLDAIKTIGAYKTLDEAKSAAEDNLIDLIV